MKRFLSIFGFAVFLCLCMIFPVRMHAQTATKSGTTNITVTVAGYQLTVSGYVAPFASIALTINGNVVTSTTADSLGNFSFTSVSIPKTTSKICFYIVDFKNLGQSEACVSVTPIAGVITKTNIFLPPTLGIQRTEVNVGNNAVAFGYGMPGATITVHVSGSTGCIVVADKTGFYQCSILIQKAGSYELYADSVLNGKPSEAQLKKVLLKGLAVEKIPTIAPISGLPAIIPNIFAIPWWVWLLLVMIGIILLIILLRRYRPSLIPVIGIPGVPSIKLNHVFDFLFRERKLHHWWMKSVGY